MDLLAIISFAFISSLAVWIINTRNKRTMRQNTVAVIMLATSSVAAGWSLKSMYALGFYGLHLVLLIIALTFAIKMSAEQKRS